MSEFRHRASVQQVEAGAVHTGRAQFLSSHVGIWVRKASSLGCIKGSVASRSVEVVLSFYSAVRRPPLEYHIQFWDSQYKEYIDL